MNSRKSKMLTRLTMTPTLEVPCPNQLPPFIPNMRPPSRHMKRRWQKCILFPDIGNSVNSVTRGNPLPSIPGVPAAPKLNQHGKTRDAATFLSATDRARIFGINKWY